MTAVQDDDRKSAFLFVGDFNAHHRDWLSSVSPTDSHGIAALDFGNITGCIQLVTIPTYEAGNCLDLVFTDVPDIVRVDVTAPLDSSDHSCISLQVNHKRCVVAHIIIREVFLKNKVNWSVVRDEIAKIILSLLFHNDDPVVVLNDSLKDIISRKVPLKCIKYRSNDKAWFTNDCRKAREYKQAAYHRWSRCPSDASWHDYVAA